MVRPWNRSQVRLKIVHLIRLKVETYATEKRERYNLTKSEASRGIVVPKSSLDCASNPLTAIQTFTMEGS